MSTEIRVLQDDELARFAQIAKGAYPSFTLTTEELTQRLLQSRADDPISESYGIFRDGQLLGGMRLFDFTMSYHGIAVPVGGVGLVAVDLLQKKRGVAKDLIAFFLRHYRERGAPFTALYPFRPDFYRQMGFGYGSKLGHYRLRPASFPRGPVPTHLRFLAREDAPALLACYNAYAARTHGLFQHQELHFTRVFDDPERQVLAYCQGETIRGYMIYKFQHGATFLENNIEVLALICDDPAAMGEFCSFLHSQADQITTVILNTQDDQIHHLVHDPRNGSGNLFPSVYHETNGEGVGIMYRVIDLAGFFQAVAGHPFGGGYGSLTLAINLADSFLPEAAGSVTVRFQDGRPTVDPAAAPDARISLSVEQLSPLLMGSATFYGLLRYGLAEIDNPYYSEEVHRLFLSAARPVCVTPF